MDRPAENSLSYSHNSKVLAAFGNGGRAGRELEGGVIIAQIRPVGRVTLRKSNTFPSSV